MKKLLPVLFVFLMLLLSACGGKPRPQATESPTETTAPATGETVPATEPSADQGPEGVTDPPGNTVTIYVLTRMAQLNDDGSELWYREYEYDSQGLQTALNEFASDGSLSCRQVFSYDDAGRCISAELQQSDGPTMTTTYGYDDRGNLILQETREGDLLISRDEFTYDDQGNRLTGNTYSGDELIGDWSWRYTFDEQGNQLTREEYVSGELVYTVEYRYDSQGRPCETLTRRADGSLEHRCVVSWDGSTETKIYYDMEDTAYLSTMTSYDDQGNPIFQESQYSDGTVTMTDYTYEPIEIQP